MSRFAACCVLYTAVLWPRSHNQRVADRAIKALRYGTLGAYAQGMKTIRKISMACVLAVLMMIALLCFTGGCGVVQARARVSDDYVHPVGVVEVVPPPLAAQAIQVELASMALNTGAPVPDDVSVHWTADVMPYESVGAVGLSYGCDDMWVQLPTNPLAGPIPLTLAHELGHCMRLIALGDSDHSHIDAAWWGDTGIVEQAHHAMIHQVLGL